MPTRPNILWISFEDMPPYYGCYGDAAARTPCVDGLAREGLRYTRCFAVSGVCAPTRSSIITGMYPMAIGTHHMRTTHTNPATPEMPTPYSAVIPHYVKCFTEYLRAAGYFCTNNEKTDYQFDPPFTAWDELGPHAHWRNRPDPKQPFFAVFNPMRTHESGVWPENCPNITFDPTMVRLPPYFPDTPKVRETKCRMYTQLEESDRELGRLLRQLAEDGLAENTYVFHFSDHGCLPRGKRWPYDAGIHVPLIVRGPGLEAGRVVEELVCSMDLGPTVLSLAGVPVPGHVHGRAFLGPQARGVREYVFAGRDRHDEAYDMVRAARDKRFKYLRHYRPDLPYVLWIPYSFRHPIMQELWRLHLAGELNEAQSLLFRPRPAEELYDTEADPFEVRNLADNGAYAAELARLRAALDGWLAEVGDMGRVPEVEMVRNWYPDGRQPETAVPVLVAVNEGGYGAEPMAPGVGAVKFHGPTAVMIHCATQGASIGYTMDEGEGARWRLYTGPLRLPPGRTVLRAKAVRIGYKESAESQQEFEVKMGDLA